MGVLAKSLFRELPSTIRSSFVDTLLAGYPSRDFQVQFWDGILWGETIHPRFTLILKNPVALRALLQSPSELSLGEAYIYDDFDIDGDIESALDLGDYVLNQRDGKSFDISDWFHKLPERQTPRQVPQPIRVSASLHSRQRDRQAISYHYDLPSDFYSLWLDPRMIYSCAYFASPDQDLETAQARKVDYICRKLRLHPGEHLLDIGCGWGGLVMHAAARYGVHAVGVTLSVPQAEVARRRVREAGLNHRVRIEVADYRDIDHGRQYDKIASVGMFEHVGEALLPEYFQRAWDLLRPGGAFLNHGIAYSATYERKGRSFIDRYVFPDGELVPISRSLRQAELIGFEVRDVESLREHYALTLRHWVQRLEANAVPARRITDDTTYRIWRLFMAGSARGFRTGRMNLYQALLAKPAEGKSGFPLTRQDWYRN
jgi:cyclopropane-fatty-acyl-phospholipid synthase